MNLPRRTVLAAGAAGTLAAAARAVPTEPCGCSIDVHAHFIPPPYLDALAASGVRLLDNIAPIPEWDPERHLAIMDDVGIATSMLSVSAPHVAFAPDHSRATLCRAINDYAAELVGRNPSRFGAFAILPLPDVERSLDEIQHALDRLGLDGVGMPTNVSGLYLGDPALTKILAALNERSATIYVHPTSPECFAQFKLSLPSPMLEYPFDTTRTIASLLFSRSFQRYPNIRFIFSHAGGALPFLTPRISMMGQVAIMGDQVIAADETRAVLGGLYYDMALSANEAQLMALRAIAPVTRILYGSDFPFAPAAAVRASEGDFARLPLSSAERFAIRRGNALGLFKRLATITDHHGKP